MTELEAAIIEGEELIETEYDTGDQYPKWLLELLAASRAYAALQKLTPDIKALVEAGDKATPTDKLDDVSAVKIPKVVRPDGSQRFPFIPLPKALDRVREMYKVAANHEVSVATAGKSWGYSEKSSGVGMTVSALKYFGLIEDVGSNDARKIKLSDAALKIIRDPREISPDREILIRQAALLPSIHNEIVSKYNGLPPSDEAFKAYLLLDRGFKDDAATDFIKEFMATMAFAKISDSGKIREKDYELASHSDVGQNNMQQTPLSIPVVVNAAMQGERIILKEDERIIFKEEESPKQYVWLVAAGDLNEYLLEALEDFIKRQRKRLGIASTK